MPTSASTLSAADKTTGASRLLIVEVRGRHYGLDAERVHEIVPVATTARLAGAPPWVLGLMNLRGTLVPAMDLGLRIDAAVGAASPSERSAVIVRDGARFLAVVVDEVHEVQQVTAAELEAAPSHAAAASPLVTEMGHFGGQIVLLIDVSELLRQVLA